MQIGNLEFELVRKDIKNIHLAVYPPDGRVRLAAPFNVKDETLELYVISKLGWIRRQQRKFENQNRQSPRQFVDRESHYFLGTRYLLRVFDTSAVQPATTVLVKGKTYLDFYVRPNSSIVQKEYHFKEWYRAELKKVLAILIPKWEEILGQKANKYTIKQMKTQWGSCNATTGTILLNLELIKKPEYCIEYVLAHELIHLLVRNHNEQFRYYMDTYLPNWESIKAELNSLPVGEI